MKSRWNYKIWWRGWGWNVLYHALDFLALGLNQSKSKKNSTFKIFFFIFLLPCAKHSRLNIRPDGIQANLQRTVQHSHLQLMQREAHGTDDVYEEEVVSGQARGEAAGQREKKETEAICDDECSGENDGCGKAWNCLAGFQWFWGFFWFRLD